MLTSDRQYRLGEPSGDGFTSGSAIHVAAGVFGLVSEIIADRASRTRIRRSGARRRCVGLNPVRGVRVPGAERGPGGAWTRRRSLGNCHVPYAIKNWQVRSFPPGPPSTVHRFRSASHSVPLSLPVADAELTYGLSSTAHRFRSASHSFQVPSSLSVADAERTYGWISPKP